MTESDKEFIHQGVLELRNCLISYTSLFKMGYINKDQLDDCANIYNVVNDNYKKLVGGEVPLNEQLSKVTSTKGLITENLDEFVRVIKSKEQAWYKQKFSQYDKKSKSR